MNKEFWINKTIEECGEVITALCKLKNYGNKNGVYDNHSAVENEVGDLEYCLDQLKDAIKLNKQSILYAYEDKRQKIKDYAKYSLLIENDTDNSIKEARRLQHINDDDGVII